MITECCSKAVCAIQGKTSLQILYAVCISPSETERSPLRNPISCLLSGWVKISVLCGNQWCLTGGLSGNSAVAFYRGTSLAVLPGLCIHCSHVEHRAAKWDPVIHFKILFRAEAGTVVFCCVGLCSSRFPCEISRCHVSGSTQEGGECASCESSMEKCSIRFSFKAKQCQVLVSVLAPVVVFYSEKKKKHIISGRNNGKYFKSSFS